MVIRVLVADDQELVRKGMVALLAFHQDLSIVGQAAHGEEAFAMARDYKPDVVLMDIRMPVCDGIAATKKILAHDRSIKVLVLTTFDDEELIVEALHSGACGYLLKDTGSDDIASAIRTVHGGSFLLAPAAATKVVSNLAAPKRSGSKNNLSKVLTNREIEVLRLIGAGKNNKEIATLLCITEGTVKNHVSHIFAQIGARDRVHAALIAQQELEIE